MALNTTLLKRLAALGCACALSLGASACGSKQASTTSSPTASTSFTHMDGITATGNLGEQPTVSFDSLPYTVHNNSYAILQTGDGDTVQDGQRICLQNMFVNTDDGSVLSSSWGSDPVDCATITQSQTPSDYYGLLVGQKVHTTIAIRMETMAGSPMYWAAQKQMYAPIMMTSPCAKLSILAMP